MKKYKNPVLLCDYSDPDVIRVGDTFYLTASSFNFVPGLPLLESKNLVEWKLAGYAAKKIPLPGYGDVQNAKGIWAPALRFHAGLFYIFFATPDEGIFETHAKNFRGEWSEWNCVWSGKGFIDPCPLWDDDGKIYVVHGYAKSRIGFNSKLGILELDENLKAKTEDRIIFDGTETQPTIEGPKIYKRNGFYYIFAPAGGVTRGWQTVLRSEDIFGGYEEKIVLAQGKTKINGPHQGGYVETQDGSGYFLLAASTICVIFAFKGVDFKNGPVIESLGFPLVMILGRIFYGEKLTKNKLIGMGLIMLGVVIYYI